MKNLGLTFLFALLSANVSAQTYCDSQLADLKDYAMVARYEQLPEEQKSYFFAQLSTKQKSKLNILSSTHQFGSALNNSLGGNYNDSITDVFNRKYEEFKRKCGFMLK